MVKKARDGVWLVDEPYYLYDAANDRDYGQEILLNVTENNSEDLVVATTGYMDWMDQFFGNIHGMMSWIGNHINFPKYTSDEFNKIATVMARDLEYNIGEAAHSSFHAVSSARMELLFFSNARTMQNVMDRARMNSAIWTFEWFAIQGEIGDVCTVVDLNIDAQDFMICWTTC